MLAARLPECLSAEIALLRKRGAAETHSDRLHRAHETVARMRPMFGRFGITRLADVTGLDRIGIPVWMAVRPNSKTLAVSQGKGFTDAAAQASAVMEAAEIATAELFPVDKRVDTGRALMDAGEQPMSMNNLVAVGEELLTEDDELLWVEGYDLLQEKTVWVPADSAAIVPVEGNGRASRLWQSSDGLASGNVMLEAVVHGICERVERDATVLWQLRSDQEVLEACVDPASLGDEGVDELLDRINRSGFQLRLFDITSDVGVPVFFAVVTPKPDGYEKHWKHFDLSSGVGCHPSQARAAVRAITEAAQSRVTSITGARDDYDPNLYRAQLKADLNIYVQAEPTRPNGTPAAKPHVPADNLDFILTRLRQAGVTSAIAVPLQNEEGFAVAKTLVPELEHPGSGRRQRFGKRALKAMMGAR
jgi:ribosomal protein S12 methylthiotransferase accessory factor